MPDPYDGTVDGRQGTPYGASGNGVVLVDPQELTQSPALVTVQLQTWYQRNGGALLGPGDGPVGVLPSEAASLRALGAAT